MATTKLLLVDDDESILSGLGALLAARGFEVTTASNAAEALQRIANGSFDVLLSDLHMPGDGDGLTVASAMRHTNPKALTLILSANPDLAQACAAIQRQVDEVILKPVNAGTLLQVIERRLTGEGVVPRNMAVEAVATVLERESASVTQAWREMMKQTGGLAAVPISEEEQNEYLPDALREIVYRLRYPQELGSMTMFSMAALQHGARRRRQGFAATVLVEEARALQVALFQAVQRCLDKTGIGRFPATLMAIADEVNAQLLQSLSGYENEKPASISRNYRPDPRDCRPGFQDDRPGSQDDRPRFQDDRSGSPDDRQGLQGDRPGLAAFTRTAAVRGRMPVASAARFDPVRG